MDIAEFLAARYDEEADAANWSGPARIAWLAYRDADGGMRYTTVAASHGDYDPWTANGHELPTPASARIVWDPASVRRGVAAKRALLALHMKRGEMVGNVYCAEDWSELPCLTTRIMAKPYAEHPDYDPAWALEHYDHRRGGQAWGLEHSA